MKGKKCNVNGGKRMKYGWFRMVICLGVTLSFFVLGVPAVLSENSINCPNANAYYKDSYYEDYKEDSYSKYTYYDYNEDSYYKEYYYKDNYYKGSYYNNYYKDYSYYAYKYTVYYYLRIIFERFPLFEKILERLF
jgi:hypothetical protein